MPVKPTTILFLVLALSCELSDEDRCPDGLYYQKESRTCHADKEGSGHKFDSGTDQDSQTSDGTGISGLGEACHYNSDCEKYDAKHCLNQAEGQEGACTLINCEHGQCPEGYICCDCKGIGGAVYCVTEGGVLSGMCEDCG